MGGSAEYGRSIGGIVSAVTKSGTNKLSGSAFGFFRDKRLNAQTVLEKRRGSPKSEFDRQQYGASLGGPIVRDRTFFFLSFEAKDQDTPQDNNITAANAARIGLPAEDTGTISSYNRLTPFVMAKVTHNFSGSSALEATFVQSRWTEYNQLFQSFVARSRALRLNGVDTSYQLRWTRVGRWLHELKAGYLPRHYWVDAPDVGGPPLAPEGQLRPPARVATVNIPGVANFGQLNGHHQRTPTGQLLYAASVPVGRHSLKFGADFAHSRFQVARDQHNGVFSFRSVDHLLRGEYTTFTQRFQDPSPSAFRTRPSTATTPTCPPSSRIRGAAPTGSPSTTASATTWRSSRSTRAIPSAKTSTTLARAWACPMTSPAGGAPS
jgi:hypothetical protein